MPFLRTLFAICRKDLLSELRQREILNTILFFSVLIIFLFSFALGTDPALLRRLAGSLLWLVVLFSILLALERSFQAELEEGCLDRLVLYATSPRAVFLGKLLTNFIFVLIVQGVVLFMMIFLFDLGAGAVRNPGLLLTTLFLGDLGIATLGTFYAALIIRTRARQVMLPLLLFPMLTPLFLSVIHVTQAALGEGMLDGARAWLTMLAIYDVIFFCASLMAVQPLMEA